MRGNALVYGVRIRSVRESHMNVGVLEPEPRVDVRSHFVVCFHNVLDVNIYEVVERVDMLLNEAFDFQKCRQ